jgi:hypothetical protein
MADTHEAEIGGDAHRVTRRGVLGVAATLGMLTPAAPALAPGLGERSAGRPAELAAGPEADAGGNAARTLGTAAIWGASITSEGIGVRGNGHVGVVGEGTSYGVTGEGFVGVRGTASIVRHREPGVGVLAQALSPGSTALRAEGPSHFDGVTTFSRSGVTRIRRGSRSARVTGVPMTSATAILATLQRRVSGVHLHAVETSPDTGSFTIHLNAGTPADLTVGWLALG